MQLSPRLGKGGIVGRMSLKVEYVGEFYAILELAFGCEPWDLDEIVRDDAGIKYKLMGFMVYF